MNPILKVLKNSTALSLSVLLERFAGVALSWYVARFIGRELWGEYNTALSFVLVAVAIGPWGLNTLLPREIGRSQERLAGYLGSSLLIGLGITVVTVSTLAVVVYWLSYPADLRNLIYVALFVTVLPQVEGFIFEAAVIGIERMEWVIVSRLPMTILRVGSSIIFLSLGYGVEILYIIFGIYHTCVTIIYYFTLKRAFPNFQLRPNREHMRLFWIMAVPFVIATGVTEIFGQLDRIFLSKLRDVETVGVYATGILLVQLLLMLAPAVMDSLFPSLSRVYVNSAARFEQLIEMLTKLLVVGLFPLTVIIITLAELVILGLFGTQYIDSVLVLRITIIAVLPSYVSRLWYRATLASNHDQMGVAVAVAGGIAQVIFNILLIPRFGLIGASIALLSTVLVRTIHNFLNIAYISSRSLLKPVTKLLAPITISSVVYMLLFMHGYLVWATVASLLLFAPLLFIFKALELQDVRYLWALPKR